MRLKLGLDLKIYSPCGDCDDVASLSLPDALSWISKQ
jgi:hypothetical protein